MDIDEVRAPLRRRARRRARRPPSRTSDDLRFELATRQLKDYSTDPQTRKQIARILTVQTERQLAGPVPRTAGR